MALGRIGSTTSAVGVGSATITGLEDPTNATLEIEFKTVVQGKDSQGELKGLLLGKKSASLSAEGYVSTFAPPAPGDAMTVGGIAGKIVSSSLKATVEDFAKATAQGRAVES